MFTTLTKNTGLKNANISEAAILWATGGLTQRASHGLTDLKILSDPNFSHVWWRPSRGTASTIQSLTSDLISVTEQLYRKPRVQQIYLVGFCLGTIPAIHAVAARPDLFHGYIGIAQRAYHLENERSVFYQMLHQASAHRDRRAFRKLYKNGSPDISRDSSYNFRILWKLLAKYSPHQSKFSEGKRLLGIIAQQEWKSLFPLWCTSKLLTNTYANAMTLDLDVTRIKVPVFLFHGRQDYLVSPSLSEVFFRQLQAPQKTFYWFERSGHFLFYDEQEKFHQLIIESLAQCSDSAPPGDSIPQ